MKSSAEFRDLWLNDDIREPFDNCLDKYQVIATHKRYYRLWVRWFISQGFPIKRTIDETLAILQRHLEASATETFKIRTCLNAVQIWLMLHPTECNVIRDSWQSILEGLKKRMDVHRFSARTIDAYYGWWSRFVAEYKVLPTDLTETYIQQFIDKMVVQKRVSASTQNQLFCALQKLWIEGLGHECLNNKVLLRAPDSHYLPFVLSKADIKMLLAATPPDWKLLFSLTYGCGLRLNEALNLRIKDVMLNRDLVIVQTGKGGKSRSLPFPTSLKAEVETYLVRRRKMYEVDLEAGVSIREIQERLGHAKLETTMIYTHVRSPSMLSIQSPLDVL